MKIFVVLPAFCRCLGVAAVLGLPVMLDSCIVATPRRRAVVVQERRVAALPVGARVVTVRGERCWEHRGVHYRRHAHGGFVVFVP